MNENSGGDVGYYVVQIDHPKRFKPCVVECEDIIAALGMDFFEGELFKAAWRKAAQRTLGVGKAGNSALRDAQKMAHYGARCLALEEQRGMPARKAPAAKFDPSQVCQWMPGDEVKYTGPSNGFYTSGDCYTLGNPLDGYALNVLEDDGTPHGWSAATAPKNFYWISRPEAKAVPQ